MPDERDDEGADGFVWDDDEPPSTDAIQPPGAGVSNRVRGAADRTSAGVSAIISNTLGFIWLFTGGLTKRLTYAFMKVAPFIGAKWWKGLTIFSLNAYFKRTRGRPDALGLVTEKDSQTVKLKPARIEHNVDEIDEESGWNVKGEDRYWKRSQHPEVFRIGKVPVVLFDRDSTRAGSPLECTVTEAIDEGGMSKLYNVEGGTLTAEIDYGDAMGQNPAVADGGATVSRGFDPRGSPIFEDMIIDLGAGEGFAGRALSFTAYKDHQDHDTDVEELVKAEERGRLAGLAGMDKAGFVLKVMLIAAAIVLGVLAIIFLGPQILSGGGGGGGGGSIVPFATSLLGVV